MGKIDLEYLGACGIYCKSCDIHIAGETGDRKAQERIADWIVENSDVDCDPSQIRCCGCWGTRDQHWSEDCKVMLCATERGVKLCTNCVEYPGCDTLESFYRGGDYEAARKTLVRIKSIGIDAWTKEKEAGHDGPAA